MLESTSFIFHSEDPKPLSFDSQHMQDYLPNLMLKVIPSQLWGSRFRALCHQHHGVSGRRGLIPSPSGLNFTINPPLVDRDSQSSCISIPSLQLYVETPQCALCNLTIIPEERMLCRQDLQQHDCHPAHRASKETRESFLFGRHLVFAGKFLCLFESAAGETNKVRLRAANGDGGGGFLWS